MQTPLFFLNDDSKLLDALRNGNDQALAELFQKNRRPITSLVLRNQGTEDDAEDILQEALVVLWEKSSQRFIRISCKIEYIYLCNSKKHMVEAGEVRDHAGGEIDLAHAVVVDVGDVKDVARWAKRDAQESRERGARRLATVAVVAERAVAGDGVDDAARADAAHAVVVGVRDVHGAVCGNRHAVGRAQRGRDRGATVTGEAPYAVAGNGRHVGRERRRCDVDRRRADQSEKQEHGDYRNPQSSSCASSHALPPVGGVSRVVCKE